MQRATKYVVGLLASASLLCGILLIRGSAPQVPSGAWAPAGNMAAARAGAASVLLQNGRTLITGGDSSGVAQSSLEIYDPASGAFAFTVGALSSPRESHAAAALQDGRVLLVGGNNGKQQTAPTVALATSDLYDPATESVAVGL